MLFGRLFAILATTAAFAAGGPALAADPAGAFAVRKAELLPAVLARAIPEGLIHYARRAIACQDGINRAVYKEHVALPVMLMDAGEVGFDLGTVAGERTAPGDMPGAVMAVYVRLGL